MLPRSIRKRRPGIRVQATPGIPACCYIRPDCASIFYRSVLRADVEKRVSSVAGLAINARSDVPAFLQCLTDLLLGEMFLLCPIVGYAFWLAVLRYELRRFHVIRVPIKIEN